MESQFFHILCIFSVIGREFNQFSSNNNNKILVVENMYDSFSTIIQLHCKKKEMLA